LHLDSLRFSILYFNIVLYYILSYSPSILYSAPLIGSLLQIYQESQRDIDMSYTAS